MKVFIFLIITSLALFGCAKEPTPSGDGSSAGSGGLELIDKVDINESDALLRDAFLNKKSNIQAQGVGTVTRLLADDNNGSRHQRFIITLATKQTLLVAHNIDLAARIDALKLKDVVEFYGEYEWNLDGGVIHWTHDDPLGVHINGWLRHNNILYQ